MTNKYNDCYRCDILKWVPIYNIIYVFYKNFYILFICIYMDMEKHINKKIIIAISFATIMVMVGFTGLMYYNPENNHGNKVTIPKLGHYIKKYNFKEVDSISHTTIFNNINPDVANNTNKNTTITMGYTLYNGTSNVTGTLLHVYKNGKLFHESLMVNSTDNKSSNYSVIPLYSKSNNYNITTITNNTNATSTKNSNDAYIDLCGIYSVGSNGFAISLNQYMTDVLLVRLTVSGVAIGLLAGPAGVVVALILAIGIGMIRLEDDFGGLNGVFFTSTVGWWGIMYPGVGSPYNDVPSDLSNYVSYPLTLYKGNGNIP